MPEKTESLGLRTLEDISTLILHSHDLQETLDNIVNVVSRRMASDVCSIYLLDDDGETLRLHATKGLIALICRQDNHEHFRRAYRPGC